MTVGQREKSEVSSNFSERNVFFVTLGCAKNTVDSEVMLGALNAQGYNPVSSPEEADLIVVNTCAFLQSAVDESVDHILELVPYRNDGKCGRLVVAGCLVERYRGELEEALPEVDQFVSTDELLQIGGTEETTPACFNPDRQPVFLYDDRMPRALDGGCPTAFVKIAEGCDRPCSFCIIAKLRGSFRSRSIDSVCREVSGLLAQGVREINLVAQDLTAYGRDLSLDSEKRPRLVQLLRSLASLSGDENYWIRLLYAYPAGITDELLEAILDTPVICNYLDLPLQHISDSVLKRMHRPLGESGTRSLILKIRESSPSLALRTTFLVGFPGETEEDVRLLEDFVGEGHFTHVGVFAYSHEPEARCASDGDPIAPEVKEERRARIMLCQQKLVRQRAESLLGTRHRVLIEGAHKDTDLLLSARTEWQAPETDGEIMINEIDDAILDRDMNKVCGRFGEVEITEVAGYDLIGRLLRVVGD